MKDIGIFFLNKCGNWDLALREMMYITRIVINDVVTIYTARPGRLIRVVNDLENHLGKRIKIVESQSVLDMVKPDDT